MSKDMDMPRKLLIGADPELFLVDKAGQYVSAHDAIPGTKAEPFLVDGGAIQVDGVSAEFNIEPAETLREFIQNLHTVVTKLKFITESTKPGCMLSATPTAIFDKKYFDDLPEYAKELGCSPDYNAWTGRENPKPKTNLPMRTGAGHIHLGWTQDEDMSDIAHFHDCLEVVKQLDYCIFVPSHAWDKDDRRRNLYGNVGAFRPKPYGCEYRVLSNAWVNKPDVIPWLYNALHTAHALLEDDIKLWQKPSFAKIMNKSKISDDDIIEYNAALVDYGFDPLPQSLVLE